ncbi:MAG: MaoC family dehydratase N-terminal domain-containing protein, partial [Burkholderiales bacterium]
MPDTAPRMLRARTFDQLRRGDTATLTRRLTRADLRAFALASGDMDPTHVDADWARRHGDGRLLARPEWAGALFSVVLGNELPGPGTVPIGQRLRFERPVREDDTLTVTATVRDKHPDGRTVVFDCRCT